MRPADTLFSPTASIVRLARAPIARRSDAVPLVSASSLAWRTWQARRENSCRWAHFPAISSECPSRLTSSRGIHHRQVASMSSSTSGTGDSPKTHRLTYPNAFLSPDLLWRCLGSDRISLGFQSGVPTVCRPLLDLARKFLRCLRFYLGCRFHVD